MLAASKDPKQISTEQNSTCISQNTLQIGERLPCSSEVILNEENTLVCPEINLEDYNSLESVNNKNLGISSNMTNFTLLGALFPMSCQVISTINEATLETKTPNKKESVAKGKKKSSKASKPLNKRCSTLNIFRKKKAKIDQTDPSAVTPLKSNVIESLTSPILEISQGMEGEQQYNPYVTVVSPICKRNDHSYSVVSPMTEKSMKIDETAVKYMILPKSSFISRKKKNCLTNSVASKPTNNKLVTEEVSLSNRMLLTNSDNEPSQETVFLSMEENDPTTVTVCDSVLGVQKIIGDQKSICSAENESGQESTSVSKPAAVTLNSTNTTDNKNTQSKVVALSKNISTNLIDTTHNSTTLNKSTENNLNEVKQMEVLNLNDSNDSASPIFIFSNVQQPLYSSQFSDKCENSASLSDQQWNYPLQTTSDTSNNRHLVNTATIPILYESTNGYNCYYFSNKSESISIPKRSGIRYTMLRCNRTQKERPKEIKIAPKISTEIAFIGNSINLQQTNPLNIVTNTQPENNVNKEATSSLTLVNSNQVSCSPLLPLAEEINEVPVITPVQEYPKIKIIDVRTDIVNNEDVTGVSSSTDDTVQVKPSETDSEMISDNTNNLVQSSEINIVGTPTNINAVQMQSSEKDTMNQDLNPSQVPNNTDIESSNSELIDPESRILQVEVPVPQTVPKSTQQQKPDPCLVEKDKMMPSATKNVSNAIGARQIIKHSTKVSEKRKLMLLEKETTQNRRIEMLQHVFQVLNHCASMCANEDFEIWFKSEEPPTEQDLEDVQSEQEVTHTVTENPGEWVGFLNVLKVGPFSENKTPKRRSSKTVTQQKRNYKRREVAFCGRVQKRKLNLDDDATVADLPGTSSKIRKVCPDAVVKIESSSSIASYKEPAGNLALPKTEVQEMHFMAHDDQNLSKDELEHGGETSRTDKVNDSQTGVGSRRRKVIPETSQNSETQKKHEIPTRVRKKLGSSRKRITENPKKSESKFIFTEDVIVKIEDIDIKPDVHNYDTWNDEILCQDFGIQECYVRLRRLEDLYPLGYSSIDFDAIFS